MHYTKSHMVRKHFWVSSKYRFHWNLWISSNTSICYAHLFQKRQLQNLVDLHMCIHKCWTNMMGFRKLQSLKCFRAKSNTLLKSNAIYFKPYKVCKSFVWKLNIKAQQEFPGYGHLIAFIELISKIHVYSELFSK